MRTKEIDGATYTMIDQGTYADENGGEWVAFEKREMQTKVNWATRELAKIAKMGLEEFDQATLYIETLTIRTETEEDLRILEILFG